MERKHKVATANTSQAFQRAAKAQTQTGGHAVGWLWCISRNQKMKTSLLTFLVLVLSLRVLGQNVDHLEPNDEGDYPGILETYYKEVNQRLLTDLSDQPLIRYKVLPSFSEEYVVSLEKEANGYRLKLNTLSENYWYAKHKSQVKARHSSAAIDQEMAEILHKLYSTALGKSKKPDEMTMGCDGISYYFSVYQQGVGLVTGKKWSPDQGSLMNELIEISELLPKYLRQTSSMSLRKQIMERSKQLIENIEKG